MSFPEFIAQHSSFGISTIEWWHHLPLVNASLNGTSAALLLLAFFAIKQRKFTIHATLMISAFITSTVFLACYLLYHGIKLYHHQGVTPFPPGRYHSTYMAILLSHSFLAVVILPLIFASFYLAWKRRWLLHHKVSSVTFPLWLYVSVTGVVVYWMLYHLAPRLS
ncbi:MAG TPA: DUF420 domain-containing protein [Tepidisphaeraceae bacterium]|jgi:uncharacterized membrane protein YozB (DUF420 family)|nr:DUF420 domain-containing protein [Tepidisphaeraceae bacterium]